MFSNKIDAYTPPKDDKLKTQSNQNFDFEGEGFSSMLEEDEALTGKLRETDNEILEDESILSTDEENKAIAKRNNDAKARQLEVSKNLPKIEKDERNLLKLMDITTKVNINSINITKSKKELENQVGPISPHEELEDIMNRLSNKEETLETTVDLSSNSDKKEKEKVNQNTLHETQAEILEDLSILSTDEENLAVVNKSKQYKIMQDSTAFQKGESDMELISELVSIQNQSNVKVNTTSQIKNAESVMAQMIEETKNNINKMSLSDLSSEDVDYIIELLKTGTSDPNFDDENNPSALSAKFLAMLKDSIINKKVFRIDFDNEISVIIKIDVDGKISTKFLTSNKEIEEGLKNNLYLLRQKFDELNVKYGDIECATSDNAVDLDVQKITEIIQTVHDTDNKQKDDTLIT